MGSPLTNEFSASQTSASVGAVGLAEARARESSNAAGYSVAQSRNVLTDIRRRC
jgi:hypothetical protein